MRAVQRFGIVSASVLLILACGCPSVAGPTLSPSAPVAATNTVPPANTAAPAGIPISYGNVALIIPEGLASGTTDTSSTEVEFPYTNPSLGEMPQHAKIVLDGYPVQGTDLEPEVIVFPAAQYADYTELTAQVISALRDHPYTTGQPLPEGLPDGPFNAQVAAVSFATGRGVRYLTQFNQAVLPVNNQQLIYYFHGLSNDGNNYVEVILPVQAAFLAPDNNPESPLPPGGIEFNPGNLGSYFPDVAARLNTTPPDQFSPSLTMLDALVQSIVTR